MHQDAAYDVPMSQTIIREVNGSARHTSGLLHRPSHGQPEREKIGSIFLCYSTTTIKLGSTLILFTIEVSEVLSKAGCLLLASMIRETSGLLMKRWRITVQLQITRSIQRLRRAPRDYW
jgi:hypothetical protein